MSTPHEIAQALEVSPDDKKVLFLQALIKKPETASDQHIQPVVERLVQSPDIAVRFWAKKVLSKFAIAAPNSQHEQKIEPVEELKEPLLGYLQKCQDAVQISYLTKELGINYPAEDLLPVFLPYLKHEDDRVVSNTLEGLEWIGSPKCVAVFAQMLENPNNRVRQNAVEAIGGDEGIDKEVNNRNRHFSSHFSLADERFVLKKQRLAKRQVIFSTEFPRSMR